jgi:predicted PurR-regulated permease PerM
VRRLSRAGEVALVALALLAAIAVAKLAAPFLIPLTAGILIAYALKPLVSVLERLHIHRAVGAALVLAALTSLLVGGIIWVRDDAAEALAELPNAARRLRIAAHETAALPTNPIGHVREAAVELNRAAAEAVGNAPREAAGARMPAPIAGPSEVQTWGSEQSSKLFGAFADLALAALLALFVLASGDTFRRKVVHMAGPTLSARRITVEILDEIDTQVQRYLLVMLVTNALVALTIWGLLALIGMQRAALWGGIAGVLHFIPYVGTAVTTAAIGIVAFLQFGALGPAALVAAAVFAVSSAIGMGLVSWLQGRASHMNPVAVFVALLFFGWLWGGWGLLLGAPLIAIVRTVAERIPAMQPFGELLGR